jgi:anion-transporting  ArsA/GET3 family ATPase
MTRWFDLIADRKVIVCCGTGGVGKTTTAASIAVTAAQAGRNAVVMTIDPAKRLADALGVNGLGNTPQIVDGPWPGTLAAVMLDTGETFDDVVRRNARDAAHAERVINNRFYRNVAGTLSGTQDYMAVEKLAELTESNQWDLVVVDTPPTRDALTFLDAPRVLSRLLDNPIYKLVTSNRGGVFQIANRAAHTIVSQLGRVVGASVVDDAVTFFQSFEGMEQGFRDRALATSALLTQDATSFVLVASPRADTLDEARYFCEQLTSNDLSPDAIVINRTLPRPGVDATRAAALQHQLNQTSLESASIALSDLIRLSTDDRQRVQELAALAPEALLLTVPLLASDIHDVPGLIDFASRVCEPAAD